MLKKKQSKNKALFMKEADQNHQKDSKISAGHLKRFSHLGANIIKLQTKEKKSYSLII